MSEPSGSQNSVFLSYASTDRERVEPLVTALESDGMTVWWDREIPRGQNFNRVIEAALGQARCAIVVWSQASVTSEWVFNEASESRKRQILIPVLIDDVEPPLEFRHLQAARLVGWTGDRSDPEWSGLRDAVRGLIQQPSGSPAALPHPARRAAATSWWQTPAGATAGVGAILIGIALLLLSLSQIGVFDNASVNSPSTGTTATGEPARTDPPARQDPQTSTTEPARSSAPAATSGGVAGDSERVNLLDPAQGGKLVIANEDGWRWVAGTASASTTLSTHGFAVFSFRNEKPVTIDGIGTFVEYTNGRNLKLLAIFASDQSETGPFRKIGEVSVPNYRNMRAPLHEFPLPPFSARYVKVEILEWQDGAGFPNGYVGSLHLLGRQR